MAAVDMAILLLAVIAFVFGYKKGFLIEFLSLLAMVFAFAIAWKLTHTAVLFLHDWLDWNLKVLSTIAFVLILLLGFYLMYWLSKLLTGALHKTLIGFVDQFLGGAFSILKWFFALSLLLWVLNGTNAEWYQHQKKESFALAYCETIAPTVFGWIRIAVPFEDVFGEIKSSFN